MDNLETFLRNEHCGKDRTIRSAELEERYRYGKKIIRNACLLDNKKMSAEGNPNIIMPTGVPL